jgi:hypothetical protein
MICSTCKRRILQHSHSVQCDFCNNSYHTACLPYTSQTVTDVNEIEKWLCFQCAESIFPFNHFDTDSLFLESLSEFWQKNHNFPFQKLEHYEFNPFELNENDSLLNINNSDPDLQYFNDQSIANTINCDYYLEDSFIQKTSNLHECDKGFSLMHLNIRSVSKNLSQFNSYCESLQFTFSVVGLTETWLTESTRDIYSINGYQHFSLIRAKKRGGGVSLFVKNVFNVTARKDLDVMNENIEGLFIELQEKNCVIGIIYRPPAKDINEFCESLSEILFKIKNENKLVYIMGDFNLNLLEAIQHLPTANFIELMYSNSLFPLISKPTRVTKHSASLIDNIFCNDVSMEKFNGILFTDISDHFPLFTINYKTPEKDAHHFNARVYSTKNINSFTNKLKECDWTPILNCTDGKLAFSSFYDKFCQFYNESFPIKTFKSKYRNKHKWLTEGLKKSIIIKNKLFIKYRHFPTDENLVNYKTYKRNLSKLMKITERQYYNNLIIDNKYNMRKIWSVIKDVINKKRSTNLPNQFKFGEVLVNDKSVIANKFNSYFVNIGNDLSKKCQNDGTSPVSYLKQSNPDTIYLQKIEQCEIVKIIKSLKNASAGHDGIHVKIIKSTYHLFIDCLTHVLNLSLENGFFPDEMKLAKIIPLHKSGDTMNITNYRPVSVLPVFSKILERMMYSRLISFLNKHDILYKFQFGFRENHGANMALITLVDKISSALDSGNIVIGLFLDLKKAFDTVNHKILQDKLFHYGIRGLALKWIIDYLNHRTQYVDFQSVASNNLVVKCGVPQGSILGPLLFLLYVNDLANVSELLLPIIFADDTNLFIQGKSVNESIDTMNTEMSKVVTWLHANRLFLNLDKTHYMIFHFNKKKINFHQTVKICDQEIERVSSTKFIGVNLDEKLTWEKHIGMVKSKIAKGLGILCKARKVFSVDTLKTLYYSIIYPHLNYCVEVWGSTAKTYLNSLFKVQKKVVRVIKSAGYRAHTDPIFTELQFLKFSEIHTYFIMTFMFKFVKGMLPKVFDNFLQRNCEISTRVTRNSHKFYLPKFRTSLFKNSIKYKGATEWNERIDFIDDKCSIHSFKKNLKKLLLKNIDN